MDRMNRRDFLIAAAAAAAVPAGAPRLLGQSTAASSASSRLGLDVLTHRPLNAQTPLAAMRAWRTPNDLFYVRSSLGPPARASDEWTLTVDGEVERPLALSLDEIRRLPAVTRPVVLECAGNGRGRLDLSNTSGIQWTHGAVSNAEWQGVQLGEVLDRAGPRSGALHFWARALDRGPFQVPDFLRSIPREIALGDAFLAYEMNGEPIPHLHGGPLRLIVPGWFGMASTKWLTHLHARREPSDNYFMATSYHYADGQPVEQLWVKSLIAEPLDEATVPVGPLRVVGVAWTGAAGIRGVDFSADGGRTWRPARLTGPEHDRAWRTWEHTLDVTRPGAYTLSARATDRNGAVQPARHDPDRGGYGNNSIHQVRVHAIAS